MIFKTEKQLLQDYQSYIQSFWGNTPLVDTDNNRGSPLVITSSAFAKSQSDLSASIEAFIARGNIAQLEGDLLNSAGAQFGIIRKNESFSKSSVYAQTSENIEKGTTYIDRLGGKWELLTDINPVDGFGFGIVCAENSGALKLFGRELKLENSVPWVSSSSNINMLEIGGKPETDEQYRNRILNKRPLWNVIGTSDKVLNDILAIDGVNYADYSLVETCIGNGTMFIVHGGDDAIIGETIKLNTQLGCNLVGETIYADSRCTEIRFQRPCPILLKLKVTLACDCPSPDAEMIRLLIAGIAPKIARLKKIRGKDIAKISDQIDKVEISTRQFPLYAEGCEIDGTVIDPFTLNEIPFGTYSSKGLCVGSACDSDYADTIKLNSWQYGIIDSNYIEFEQDCDKAEVICVTC